MNTERKINDFMDYLHRNGHNVHKNEYITKNIIKYNEALC